MASLFRLAIRRPVLILTLLLAAQTIPTLWTKDVWMEDEVRHAAAAMQMLEHGHWLVLYLGNEFYADKPPLYFWLLALLSGMLRTTGPVLFMVAAALTAWFFLFATVATGRALGLSRRAALLAGLILLSTYYFIERAHSPRMDLMFCAFIALSHLGFFRAFHNDSPGRGRWMAFSFLMAALATLTKGPIGAVLPLFSFFVFAVWQGRFRVQFDRHMATGFAVFIGLMLLYLAGVIWAEGWDFIYAIVVEQTWDRAVDAPILSRPFYFYLHKLPEQLLPWSLIMLFLPWRRLGTRDFWNGLGRSALTRRESGVAYLGTGLIASVALMSTWDYKIEFLMLTVFPQAALLLGNHLTRMPARSRRRYFTALAVLLALVLAVLPFAARFTQWPDRVHGGWLVALCGLPLLAGMVWARRRGPLVFALVMTLGCTILFMPYYLVTMRGLNGTMSPRVQAGIMSAHERSGYRAFYYDPSVRSIYDYHAGRPIGHLYDLESVRRTVEETPCGILAIRNETLDEWNDRPAGLETVDERLIDYRTFSLVRWRHPAADGQECPPPPVVVAPAP